ncbi:hypothetical protein SLEP1_g16194 [Rubroshorea leprosula]|uniref:Uncharacterized protein n=1 Tax=Rubroshorea leprosula TaxID=152421 RepID=A0AAV5J1Q7_9ROSI|nr:hypothetical protein SLEP1_g16194 [Rubroshorea leprosula]
MENSNSTSIISREKLDQVTSWVGATVASAFFASLKRFSCVNLTTTDADADVDNDNDNDNDDPLEAKDSPLLQS